MKKFVIALICIMFLLSACTNSVRTAPEPTEVGSTVLPESSKSSEPADTFDYTKVSAPERLNAEELASEFSTDPSFGEKVENAYDSDRDNQQLAAIYFYYNAIKFESRATPHRSQTSRKVVKYKYE